MPKFLFVFIATYLGGLAASAMIDISWGVALYQLVYFFNPGRRWWYAFLPDLRYSFIVAIVVLVVFIFKNRQYTENRIKDLPQAKWMISMFLMMTAIYFWSAWPENHLKFMIGHAKLIVFILIAFKVINSPFKLELTIWSFLMGQYFLGWTAHITGRTAWGRLDGIGLPDGNDANDTGAVLVTCIPLLLFYILKGKYWQKLLSLVILAYVIDAIVLVNSRGAFLGLVVSSGYMFYHFWLNKVGEQGLRIKVIGLLIAGLSMFLFLADVNFWERMDTISDQASQGAGGEGRIYFWLKTFDLVRSHPLGVGVWGYQALSPTFLPKEVLTGGIRAVHSTYFQVFAEYGYLGPVIFFGYLSSIFRISKMARRKLISKKDPFLYLQNIAIESCFIAYLVAGIFLDRLYAELMFWLPMYIACFHNLYVLKGYTSADLGRSKIAIFGSR